MLSIIISLNFIPVLISKKTILVMGYDALCQGIEHFAVRNRRNLYVCCEDNKRNVFYMQLFVSEESFRKRCLHCDTTDIDEVIVQFTSF